MNGKYQPSAIGGFDPWLPPVTTGKPIIRPKVSSLTYPPDKITSQGDTASYYELPEDAKELQDVIAYKNMNAQIGEIFRACMRYGEVSHSSKLRDAKKIRFYADEEIKRLEKYDS